MSGLSNHTLLINTVICLTKKDRCCDPVLRNNGYNLETIEVKFSKENGEKIHSDVLLRNAGSKKLLFVECKDGGLSVEQAKRYSTLSNDDIMNAQITGISSDFNHEVCYFSLDGKKDKLIDGIKKGGFGFPVVVKNESCLKLEHNSFSCELLQGVFDGSGVSFNYESPMHYYPFGPDDSDSHILSCLVPSLIAFSDSEFSVDDLIRKVHLFFDEIDPPSQKDLKQRVKRLLDGVSRKRSGALNPFFLLPEDRAKCRLKSFNVAVFQKAAQKCVDEANNKLPSEIINPLEAVPADSSVPRVEYSPEKGFT